jgi:hypothetical protein
MTAKRWELIRTMTGAGPLSIRETARRVDRDVKGVHGDVHTLLTAGILQKTEDGLVVFPYDTIRAILCCMLPDIARCVGLRKHRIVWPDLSVWVIRRRAADESPRPAHQPGQSASITCAVLAICSTRSEAIQKKVSRRSCQVRRIAVQTLGGE